MTFYWKTRPNVACKVCTCIFEMNDTCSDVLFVMQWHSDILSVFFRLLSLTDWMWLYLNHSKLLNRCLVPHLYIKPLPHDSWLELDSHGSRHHQHLLKSSWWPWVDISELTQMLGLSRPVFWLPSCLYPSSFLEITRLQRSRTQLRLCAAFKRTSQLILIDVCPTVSFTSPLKQKGFEREVCLSAHAVIGRDASLSLPRSLSALLLSSSRLLQKHLLLPLEYQGQRLLNVKMRGI